VTSCILWCKTYIIITLKKTRQTQSLINPNKQVLMGLVLAVTLMALRQETMGAQAPVNLGTAANFAILAKSGISTVPTSAVTGDIGVSPIDSTAITGFSLTHDAASPFATSSQITGKAYAPDYTVPTPANLTTAIGDMQTAYTDAAGRTTPDFTELGAGQIGGLTLSGWPKLMSHFVKPKIWRKHSCFSQ
jgi:Ice-binding-like